MGRISSFIPCMNAGVLRAACFLTGIFVVVTAVRAQDAQTIAIHLNPETTSIRWTLNAPFHKAAHGSIHLKGGDIVVNPKTGLAQGEVLVDATTLSGEDARQTAKWQQDILDTTTYPAILFHPNKVEGLSSAKGSQQVKASGAITLRGHDHLTELPLKIDIDGKQVTVTGRFTIPYTQWGLKAPSAGLLHYDKQITVDVEAHGMVREQKATPGAPPSPDSQ